MLVKVLGKLENTKQATHCKSSFFCCPYTVELLFKVRQQTFLLLLARVSPSYLHLSDITV